MLRNAQPKPAKGWNESAHGHLRKLVLRPRVCLCCGGEFTRKSRNRILGKKYCSQSCQRRAMAARSIARAERQGRQCKHCRKVFAPKYTIGAARKFCSIRCRIAAKPIEFVDLQCAECFRPLRKRKSQSKRYKHHFCSRHCQRLFHRGENHPWHRPDVSIERRAYATEWAKLAKTIRERDGHKCRRCGCVRAEHERAFPVDHVRPWRSFENRSEADHPINLVTLCPSCHSWKTRTVEQQWLQGDVLAFKQYLRDVGLEHVA